MSEANEDREKPNGERCATERGEVAKSRAASREQREVAERRGPREAGSEAPKRAEGIVGIEP